MASSPGFEPGPHWWEASALTTEPCSLMSYLIIIMIIIIIIIIIILIILITFI